MELITPQYRTDYVGENINNMKDGETISYFIRPRENVFTKSNVDAAIVLGNGRTKDHKDVQLLLKTNARKLAQGYKLVYACNRAVHDETTYDYYVLKHRVFLANINANRLVTTYLPYDIFLDYKDNANLLPYVSHFHAGASAAYLSCFDGHKRVFLMGFDGDTGRWQTAYDGIYPYSDGNGTIDYKIYMDHMTNVMRVYRNVEFYRLRLDGQTAPGDWRSLPNFRDVTMREMVMLGDF